jgi:outer membrane receptor protein involved in Fe transport
MAASTLARSAGLSVFLVMGTVNAQDETAAGGADEDVTELSDIEVTDSPLGALGKEVGATAFGFDKPLLETPRSVSFITTDQIDMFGVSSVNDLARLVPGVFTNQRRGYEGAINVRGVPAETLYNGMRRLNFQGHTRTILGSMDSIEVVKGPPSPIFGMGKIGGYVNLTPKSGRASIGGYLPKSQGFLQSTVGSFSKSETQFGIGGPASVASKQGGYYVFGMIEDSEAYTDRVDMRQKYLQSSVSLDDFVGPFRLEVGTQYQNSKNKGVILTRVTQDVVDSGRYVGGTPLVPLDSNGDGRIGYREMHINSPVRGNISAANQPLSQRWSWPTDANGNYYELGQFPVVAGIPQSMYDYLVSSCGGPTATSASCADPTGLLRAQGVGGPTPQSGYVPAGFALDPRTVGYRTVNYRANPTLERDQSADILLAYVDLVYDANPDFTVKNQIFFDGMDQHKIGEQPFAEYQEIYGLEEKFTVTRRIPDEWLPSWLRVNSLGSINYRYNRMHRKTAGGDYDYRNDATLNMGDFTTLTRFWTAADDETYENGHPYTTINTTQYSEAGIGILFDIDVGSKTNLTIGGRYDYAEGRNTNYAAFNFSTGTSANPGRFNTSDVTATGTDSGTSYSASLSHQLPYGIRPYVTYARSSLTLTGGSQQLDNAQLTSGDLIGQSELKEAGIKWSLFNDTLFLSSAVYEQSRYDVTEPDDPSFGAEVTSVITKGVEFEAKWAPTDDIFLSAFAIYQKAEYLDVPVSANINIDARTLGFQDVVDPTTGEVIYPAEAFLYGGRAFLVMPGALNEEYGRVTGNPEHQYGLTGSYTLPFGLGINVNLNWISDTYTSRLQNVQLPEALLVSAGLTYEIGSWNLRLTGFNLTNETWFRARNGYTSPDVMNPQPTRYWTLTARYNF